MADRVLIRNGYVLTMDDRLGDIPNGDVLIEGDTILQVGRGLAAADAEVIDATGKIVLPGFIDTHRHTWETAIRGCAPDATLEDYFIEVLDTFAPLYRPEDVYASNLAGALECLNAGITTLVDWSHINNTPEHPDAAIQGLQDAGIRAVYAYGPPNTSLQACWFNSTLVTPREDGERMRKTYFNSDKGLLTMALATCGPAFAGMRWCGPSGRWRETWHSRSRSTSPWGGWLVGDRWSPGCIGSACFIPTRPTFTAVTSPMRNGSSLPRVTAIFRSRHRWRCKWDTAGRRS